MNLIKILNDNTGYYNRIIKLNKKTQRYDLLLTPDDVSIIIDKRGSTLEENRMVDLDIQVTVDIIDHLTSSPFVAQDNFLETILGIQEIFYYIKGETDAKISDEKLLAVLFEYYDDRGSIELLSGIGADSLIRQINLL